VEEFIVEIEGPPKNCDVTRWGQFTDTKTSKKRCSSASKLNSRTGSILENSRLGFRDCCGDTIGFETDNPVESRQGSCFSMESPKREQISYVKAWVLIVDQVQNDGSDQTGGPVQPGSFFEHVPQPHLLKENSTSVCFITGFAGNELSH
jgi:hypothetical protein